MVSEEEDVEDVDDVDNDEAVVVEVGVAPRARAVRTALAAPNECPVV